MTTTVTVKRGDPCALVFTFDDDLDTDTASLTVTDPSSVAVLDGVTAGIGAPGSGVQTYVWTPSSTATTGEYAAVMSGEILGEAVTDTVLVRVTGVDPLVSLAAMRAALDIPATDTTKDDLIQLALEAATEAIRDECNRQFVRDGTTSARTYTTRGRSVMPRNADGGLLLVDDIATATGLAVELGDGTAWTELASSNWTTSPDNAIARVQAITGLVWYGSDWLAAVPRVRVTADWGWPAVPTAIQQACQLQAGRLFRRRLSPEGVAGSSEWGLIRVPHLDPDVARLCAPYKLAAIG